MKIRRLSLQIDLSVADPRFWRSREPLAACPCRKTCLQSLCFPPCVGSPCTSTQSSLTGQGMHFAGPSFKSACFQLPTFR